MNLYRRPLTLVGLAAAVLMIGTGAAGTASALSFGGDHDVARTMSFGGSCQHCELSGRKLGGATFTSANFNNATLVGTDLRDAMLLGSYFNDSNFSRADLRNAQMMGAKFHGAFFQGA